MLLCQSVRQGLRGGAGRKAKGLEVRAMGSVAAKRPKKTGTKEHCYCSSLFSASCWSSSSPTSLLLRPEVYLSFLPWVLGPCSGSMAAVRRIFTWAWGSGLVVGLAQTGTRTLITPQALRAVELASSLHPSTFFLISSLWALSA